MRATSSASTKLLALAPFRLRWHRLPVLLSERPCPSWLPPLLRRWLSSLLSRETSLVFLAVLGGTGCTGRWSPGDDGRASGHVLGCAGHGSSCRDWMAVRDGCVNLACF